MKLASICLSLWLLCRSGICADVGGTVRVAMDSMPSAEPDKRPPARFASITLCSVERAYRMEGDKEGRFQFAGVQSGVYDLVAVSNPMTPTTVSNVKVSEKELVSPLTVLVPGASKNSACWVNSRNSGTPFKFEVDYQTPEVDRTAPVIQGEVGRWVQKHPKSAVVVKPLAQAQVQLFRAGEITPIMNVVTDKSGRFEFYPEPGIYELQMSYKGYHDVHVPAFLVPRENITAVSISSAEAGVVVTGL